MKANSKRKVFGDAVEFADGRYGRSNNAKRCSDVTSEEYSAFSRSSVSSV